MFGYGSIIYRVDFPTEHQVFGYIKGRQRAFLQESHDHRGTDTDPGRVCTLVPYQEWNRMSPHQPIEKDHRCWGMAYKVQKGKEQEVKRLLDIREKDGYSIEFVDVFQTNQTEPVLAQVLVYVGDSKNPSFAGASTLEDTAQIISRAEGPSGTNREYLFKLCDSLRQHRPDHSLDPYLQQLESKVKRLLLM